MSFESASKNFSLERKYRQGAGKKLLRFGVDFVDDGLFGILPDDLVLVGAPSGVGKTQFCVNLALTNAFDGKKVHMFALEAGRFEIERRLKYRVVMEQFYADPERPKIPKPLYDEWDAGFFDEALAPYEEWAEDYCAKTYQNLFTFYKSGKFDCDKLIELVMLASHDTDLIMIDHAHYFDWDDDNENRALKKIAMTSKDLCQQTGKPIVLIAQFRKSDRGNKQLAADLAEFHGSSDLTKIATKVITFSSGGPGPDRGTYVSYFRLPKNRELTSTKYFLGRCLYNERTGSYENEYQVGWANAEKFGSLGDSETPSWVGRTRRRREGVDNHPAPKGLPKSASANGEGGNLFDGASKNPRD